MTETLQLLISTVTSSGVTAIILAILQRKWVKDDKQDAVRDALKVMMIDRVQFLGQKYIAAGSISLGDKETIQEMHRAYKALGGNGHLNTIMDEIDHLQLKR